MNHSTPSRARILIVLVALLCTGDAMASVDRVDELVQMSLQLDPDVARGAKLYGQHCTGCHRRNASGNPQKLVPALAGQREAYLIKQLADFAEREREAPQMHAVVSKAGLNEPQVWADLAAYLSQLPVTRRPQSGDGTRAESGAVMFQEQCIECHNSDARGDDDGFIPSLRDQHYSYLVEQIQSLAALHRKNVDPEFMRFIEGLEGREISALADYLSRLRGPVRDRAKLRDDGALRN
jgi:cytochrome c553